MLDLSELEALVKEASPGRWRFYKHRTSESSRHPGWTVCRHGFEGKVVCRTHEADRFAGHNAAYIAALDPPTVTLLIAQARLGQLLLQHIGGLCGPDSQEATSKLVAEVMTIIKGSQ